MIGWGDLPKCTVTKLVEEWAWLWATGSDQRKALHLARLWVQNWAPPMVQLSGRTLALMTVTHWVQPRALQWEWGTVPVSALRWAQALDEMSALRMERRRADWMDRTKGATWGVTRERKRDGPGVGGTGGLRGIARE